MNRVFFFFFFVSCDSNLLKQRLRDLGLLVWRGFLLLLLLLLGSILFGEKERIQMKYIYLYIIYIQTQTDSGNRVWKLPQPWYIPTLRETSHWARICPGSCPQVVIPAAPTPSQSLRFELCSEITLHQQPPLRKSVLGSQ